MGGKAMDIRELYFRRELEIHLHLLNWRTHGESGNYCVMYKPCTGIVQEVGFGCNAVPPSDMMRATKPLGYCDSDSQNFVFVTYIEFINSGEGQEMATIPSAIWLQPLDQCPGILGGDVLNPPTGGFRKLCIGIEDWEHGDGVVHIGTSQLPSDVVKGGSHVVDTITDHEGNLPVGKLLGVDQASMIDSIFRITLGNDGIGVTVKEGGNCLFDEFQVVFGPVTFFYDSEESGQWHGGLDHKEEQKTKKGVEIPIPMRGDLLKNLKKAVTTSLTVSAATLPLLWVFQTRLFLRLMEQKANKWSWVRETVHSENADCFVHFSFSSNPLLSQAMRSLFPRFNDQNNATPQPITVHPNARFTTTIVMQLRSPRPSAINEGRKYKHAFPKVKRLPTRSSSTGHTLPAGLPGVLCYFPFGRSPFFSSS